MVYISNSLCIYIFSFKDAFDQLKAYLCSFFFPRRRASSSGLPPHPCVGQFRWGRVLLDFGLRSGADGDGPAEDNAGGSLRSR